MKDKIKKPIRVKEEKITSKAKTAAAKTVLPAKEIKPGTPKASAIIRKKKVFSKQDKISKAWLGLHNLKCPKGAHKKRKLLGRGSGSGHGKTSTRGSKGQTSRSGPGTYLGFEGGQMPLIRKIAKRGFTNIFREEVQVVNLDRLANIKESLINREVLYTYGLIKDKTKPVKILGDGDLKAVYTVQADAFSKKAAEKIKASGGKAEIQTSAAVAGKE